MRRLSTSGLFLLACCLPALAHADEPSRAGRALWLDGAAEGVWVSARGLYTPHDAARALSVCGDRCSPIVERRTCAPPECPGQGALLVAGEDIASVAPFPQDYAGYVRAVDALRTDPRLADLAAHFGAHPEHAARREQEAREAEARERETRRYGESVRWVSRHRGGERLELSLLGSLAALTETRGSFAGLTATASFVHLLGERDASEDNSESVILGMAFGDVVGGELRVHWLSRLDAAPEAEWIVAVGLAPVMVNRFERSVVRLPTYLGLLAPELGVILRADRDPAWYAAWSAPVSLLVTHDVAVDLVARLFVIDDWIPKPDPDARQDPVEVILMLSAGLRLP